MLTYSRVGGSATAHFNAIDVSTTIDAHIAAINALMAKFKVISTEAAEIQREVGLRILAVKAAEPRDWEALVKARCGLSRSRAFELMAIADGTTSVEETRRATNARKIKYRQTQAVRSRTDKQELAAATTKITALEATHARQLDRFKAEIARLSDGEALSCERDGLRGALGKVEKLLAEARALTTHYRNNESDIKARIGRALTIARTALQPAKTATAEFAAKRAA